MLSKNWTLQLLLKMFVRNILAFGTSLLILDDEINIIISTRRVQMAILVTSCIKRDICIEYKMIIAIIRRK